ncbi:MAG TPA: T9SS type A sorting domain-containing protein [Bacteroidales bacterium]|nr:T9SS type A sorting domain-containing protein [Bacteroidales bacterium]HSA42485.1 T9SS type A sorting domain-containing protein [Bacteroidales bacterium]
MKKFLLPVFLAFLLPWNTIGNTLQDSTYLVLTSVNESDPYYAAALQVAAYRNAQIVHFHPDSLDELLPVLVNLEPRYAAIVIKPTELEINFIRKFLMMSTSLDGDPFTDFSYGYITGATAADALAFVNRIIQAEADGIQDYPLNIGGYAASSLNFVFTGANDFMKYLDPPLVSSIYMETNNSGSGRNFFLNNTQYMLGNKLLDIGYNGDPHMLWLFEGGNMNPDPPVWLYDPAKIEDPAYARMGLTSFDISTLYLYPAVAFNGACHAGEPKKVMVESDIAATFGNTNGLIQFYTMSDTFSYCLSILNTGITGYFAPCGANNANDQGEEIYQAFLFHEPLGDIHKRSMDGVVMGFLGNKPKLKIYQWGGSTSGCDVLASGTFNPAQWSGACYMLGGKANRIYFGDPLYHPFKKHHSDSLSITTTITDSISPDSLHIHLEYHKPDASVAYFPVWDKFHFSDTRIYTPVELPDYVADITSCSVISASGPYHIYIYALEHFAGKTILHLEIDIPDDMYDKIDFSMSFCITFTNTGLEEIHSGRQAVLTDLNCYPNPARDLVEFSFRLAEPLSLSVTLADAGGRPVWQGLPEKLEPGLHKKQLQISVIPDSGQYFLILNAGKQSFTRKISIVR